MAVRYCGTFLIILALSSCSARAPWAPGSLAPSTVEIRFLSQQEWSAYQSARKGCEGCSAQLGYEWILGTADWSGDTCIIRFPAERGMPSRETMTHELRHCYQGGHSDFH